jgi:hypothetical protein
MLPFRTGAFLAGLPLRPVLLRYATRTVSPAWETIPAARHIFLLLCNPAHSVTCYELPVYVPTEEERSDPRLYADNVRRRMVSEPAWRGAANQGVERPRGRRQRMDAGAPGVFSSRLELLCVAAQMEYSGLKDTAATFDDKMRFQARLRREHGLPPPTGWTDGNASEKKVA